MTATSTLAPDPDDAAPAASDGSVEEVSPHDVILRDIARGGLAGLIVGLVVAGFGGRLVMRIAALVAPSATGNFTENGNRIGDITLGGSLGLIVFVGLLAAVFLGVVWVVISPWLPGTALVKGLLAMPIAVGLGAIGLIDGGNVDFLILGRDPLIVAILIVLIASIGPAMALADAWLDRRLPPATSRGTGADRAYAGLTVLGGSLGILLFLQAVAGRESQPLGLTVVVVGLATVIWWYQRTQGRATPSTILTIGARVALLIGTFAGFAVLIPEVRGTLGG